MWLCGNCGAEQEDDTAVCKQCGAVRSKNCPCDKNVDNVEDELWKEAIGL